MDRSAWQIVFVEKNEVASLTSWTPNQLARPCLTAYDIQVSLYIQESIDASC
jgi:hypothetical protein